jgi:hypothetical protein
MVSYERNERRMECKEIVEGWAVFEIVAVSRATVSSKSRAPVGRRRVVAVIVEGRHSSFISSLPKKKSTTCRGKNPPIRLFPVPRFR